MNNKNHGNYLTQSFRIRLLLAAGASCLLVHTASAALLFSEAFNYTAGGNLAGNVNPGNSVAWSVANSGLSISNVNLTFAGLADQGGNALLITNFAASSSVNTYANQTSGQVFYSFLFDPLVINGGNNYFTALNPGTSAPNGGSDAIDAQYFSTGSLRMRANAGAAVAATNATIGTTYFVVLEYDIDNKVASIFVNPTPGGAMPAANATLSGTTATALADVGFKVQSSTGQFLVDNLLIGTTWADVTPTIPEPSTFALMGFGCLSLIAVVVRRRRS